MDRGVAAVTGFLLGGAVGSVAAVDPEELLRLAMIGVRECDRGADPCARATCLIELLRAVLRRLEGALAMVCEGIYEENNPWGE